MQEYYRNMIKENSRAKIMMDYGAFMVVHWTLEFKQEYQMTIPFIYKSGKKGLASRRISEQQTQQYQKDASAAQKLAAEVVRPYGTPCMEEEAVKEICSKKENELLARGDDYLIIREKARIEERYSIHADACGYTCIATQEPWGYTISKGQAERFAKDRKAAEAFFKSVYPRYR